MGGGIGVDEDTTPAPELSSVIKVYTCDFNELEMDFRTLPSELDAGQCGTSLVSQVVVIVMVFEHGQAQRALACEFLSCLSLLHKNSFDASSIPQNDRAVFIRHRTSSVVEAKFPRIVRWKKRTTRQRRQTAARKS